MPSEWSPHALISLCVGLALAGGALIARLLRRGLRVADREIVESLTDAVLVFDAAEQLIFWNRAAARLLDLSGASRATALDAALSEHAEIARFVRGRDSGRAEVHLADQLSRARGSWYEMEITPLRDLLGLESCRLLVLRDISGYKAAERRIRTLAYYDGLTGLPNREHFQNLLSRALDSAQRLERPLGLLFLDLDRFKEVNDTLGHRAGDALLCEVADRLERCIRASDCVGRSGPDEEGVEPVSRLGGDEFTVLLTDLRRPLDAAGVAQRLLDVLAAPFEVDGHEVVTGASIGIAVHPEDGADAERLLRNADTAMYVAKRRGRSEFAFYDQSMNVRGARRLNLEGRLRQALERDELHLVYQPLRDARSAELVGAEALLRWELPGEGSVPPDEFVPIAEDTGLIHEIGDWVLRTACRQARSWREAGFAPLRVGVNISSHQLRRAGFFEIVEALLEEHELKPWALELELTESSIMGDDDGTQLTIQRLDELGVSLALDDFGTGYSSLSYLRRFRLHRVKIDRSFVRDVVEDPGDRDLTAAIIAMAQRLSLRVVAEGVEREDQARLLQELGCDELQGYLLGRPSSPVEFERFLEREKIDPARSA